MKDLYLKHIKKYNLAKNLGLRTGLSMIILFLLFNIKNKITFAFWLTLIIWFLVACIFFIIIFSEEFYEPIVMKKRIRSKRYEFLVKNNFKVVNSSFFEGTYQGFQICIFPKSQIEKKKRNIQYEIIQSFYIHENSDDIIKKEKEMSGLYHFGNLYFRNQSVIFIPKDFNKINFEETLDSLIIVLKRENLKPRKQIIEDNMNHLYS